jgi:hypothetical protein
VQLRAIEGAVDCGFLEVVQFVFFGRRPLVTVAWGGAASPQVMKECRHFLAEGQVPKTILCFEYGLRPNGFLVFSIPGAALRSAPGYDKYGLRPKRRKPHNLHFNLAPLPLYLATLGQLLDGG